MRLRNNRYDWLLNDGRIRDLDLLRALDPEAENGGYEYHGV
jgi:hypothetical protein